MANQVSDPTLDRAQSGDGDAFAQLVAPTLPTAYRLAYGMLMNRDDAMDAVQEATVRAWRKINNVTRGLPFAPWYLGIVTRECRQATGFRWRFMSPLGEAVAGDRTADVDLAVDMRSAMRSLSPAHRQVVLLHFYGDLTLEQVGLATGTPLGTVKSRLSRALELLRSRLGEQDLVLEVKHDA
ncbi:MAG: RNA polymerase sigma factor [Candidatus Dormibacteraeota bacterium]|nr:RNA polymerase sigma factor [Candidatus Dormibacteraeota bacterium]